MGVVCVWGHILVLSKFYEMRGVGILPRTTRVLLSKEGETGAGQARMKDVHCVRSREGCGGGQEHLTIYIVYMSGARAHLLTQQVIVALSGTT